MPRILMTVPFRLVNHSRPCSEFERRIFQAFYGRRLAAAGKNYYNIYNPEGM